LRAGGCGKNCRESQQGAESRPKGKAGFQV
jgi:hypothetical protein